LTWPVKSRFPRIAVKAGIVRLSKARRLLAELVAAQFAPAVAD